MAHSGTVESLKELTSLFETNIKQYKSVNYDEANTRVDFIDKFFSLLDWDVANKQGYSEVYREVIREDKVEIDGKQKAPDYSFRIGGIRKFFVEAKKPAVNIKDDRDPAFQVRRYGYTAKLPLSILTDFEEFAIYDTRIKPDKTDNPSVARIFYCTYDKYEENFDFIYNTFSKHAILKGSFDTYVEENKNKQGTSEVDKELLHLVEQWRYDLAKNIALRNPDIDIYTLNNAVQRVIDRLIFLRIAEDKEIEEYGALLSLAKVKDIYRILTAYFRDANEKYNSGLFLPEEWLSNLTIDDKVLSQIITSQYYPECPYEFSVLPIEILGNIYEQFLGKTIKFKNVRGGHTVEVEEKPDVRKAGGVFYTPQYVVDFIVKNTVGNLVEGKKPESVSEIKICDPACGSGSFLVRAFQYLLDFHLDYYSGEKQRTLAQKQWKIYAFRDYFKLTIEEKQRILVHNIFGVDIDPQAVEVTKLSLYLKLLEDEGKEAQGSGSLFRHSDLKLLPTLDGNVKCGNSLVEPNFYVQRDLALFGIDEIRKINAFDWKNEFPSVFLAGGFDCLVGNPPYGADLSTEEREYLVERYKSYEYQLNTFSFFFELGVKLLKEGAVVSYITPSVFLSQHYFMSLREVLLQNFRIEHILVLNYQVFRDASTGDTAVSFFRKDQDASTRGTTRTRLSKINAWVDSGIPEQTTDQRQFQSNARRELLVSSQGILAKIESASVRLGSIGTCIMGIKPYQVGKGRPKQDQALVDSRAFDSGSKKDASYKKYLIGKDIDRYVIKVKEDRFIRYGEWLAEPRPTAPFERTKIVLRQTSDVIRACIDEALHYNLNNVYNFEVTDANYDIHFVLGLLNSRLMVYVYQAYVPEKGRVFAEVKKVNLDRLPIRRIDQKSKEDAAKIERVVGLVKEILKTQVLASQAVVAGDIRLYQQKIEQLDAQIDISVYSLYGLSTAEIAKVESI